MRKVFLLLLFSLMIGVVYSQKSGEKLDELKLKNEAYNVLDKSCNYCHIKRNPSKVFSMENMSDYANDIYVQVFVKKRMPKGRNKALRIDDEKALMRWISSLTIQ